jgi:LacI family transcriptional regulator
MRVIFLRFCDHTIGSRQVVQHLLATGRQRIAFVSGDDDSVAAKERLRGYRETLQTLGLSIAEDLIVSGRFTIEGGIAATQYLLSLPPSKRPDAIFYASDAMALAGISQLHHVGLRIPDEIAVAGYGNIDFSLISEPPLTTIGVSKRQLGLEAAQLLEQMIDGAGVRPDNVEVQIELIVRSST